MIRLNAITRVFRMGDQEVRALNGVSLDIASGEYVSIMGPSGSGKSTLLNVVGLLDRPDSGRYELDGSDVTDLSETERARVRREKIGFVFQSFHLVPRLTAAENIELPLMLEGIAPAERILAIFEPRSNTMKLGTMKAQLPWALEEADLAFCNQQGLSWDAKEALAPMGAQAVVGADVDELVAAVVKVTKPGDHLLCMSNGGFGGIHEKLLDALSE